MSFLEKSVTGSKRTILVDGKDNITFKNGDHYEGDTFKDKRQGMGKYSYSDDFYHFLY
jgi:hypothetical protein